MVSNYAGAAAAATGGRAAAAMRKSAALRKPAVGQGGPAGGMRQAIAKPMPQGGEQNSGGMVRSGPPMMRGPRPDMQQIDVQQPGSVGGGGISRSFPPSSGPIMSPDQAPGAGVSPSAPFLPPRLQRQVDAGTMSQEGAQNRFDMFNSGQLPGQQGAPRMGGMAPGGPGGPGGQQADEMQAAMQQLRGFSPAGPGRPGVPPGAMDMISRYRGALGAMPGGPQGGQGMPPTSQEAALGAAAGSFGMGQMPPGITSMVQQGTQQPWTPQRMQNARPY